MIFRALARLFTLLSHYINSGLQPAFDMCFIVLCIQGDLFSEAPKPTVSQEKKVQNEGMKSTAQTAGMT